MGRKGEGVPRQAIGQRSWWEGSRAGLRSRGAQPAQPVGEAAEPKLETEAKIGTLSAGLGWEPAALTPACPATEQPRSWRQWLGLISPPTPFTTHFLGTRLDSTLNFYKALSQGALVFYREMGDLERWKWSRLENFPRDRKLRLTQRVQRDENPPTLPSRLTFPDKGKVASCF